MQSGSDCVIMEGMIFDERCVKLMKRILCLLLALLALLSMLPACAPQETVPTETNGQDLPAQATQAATEPAAATDGAQMDQTVYDISITEVMPDNRNLLLGHEMDWVELYNPEDLPISLEGYCLTNDPEKPRLMSLDGYRILAGGYLAVTLDGALQLSEQGQTVYLSCNGEVISQLTFGAAEKGEAFDEAGVCLWPTPGYANSEAGYRAYLESRELPELIISEVLASNNRYMGIRLEYYDLLEVKNNSDVPVNLKEYKDIYVYCDSDPIGYYLNQNHIRYHAVEDGLNCLKNFDAAQQEKFHISLIPGEESFYCKAAEKTIPENTAA